MEDIDRISAALDKAFLPATGRSPLPLSGVPARRRMTCRSCWTASAPTSLSTSCNRWENSPTGGALGAVSDKEGALLQVRVRQLGAVAVAGTVQENLKRLKTVYQDIIHGVGKWKEVAPAEPDATPTKGRGRWSIRPAP